MNGGMLPCRCWTHSYSDVGVSQTISLIDGLQPISRDKKSNCWWTNKGRYLLSHLRETQCNTSVAGHYSSVDSLVFWIPMGTLNDRAWFNTSVNSLKRPQPLRDLCFRSPTRRRWRNVKTTYENVHAIFTITFENLSFRKLSGCNKFPIPTPLTRRASYFGTFDRRFSPSIGLLGIWLY